MTNQELSQLYYLKKEIAQQKQRLEELKAASTNITPQITGMPHGSGVSDKVSRYAAEMADLQSLIELNVQKCWYELNRLNRYIADCDDSLVRQILSMRYINGLSWTQVALQIGGGNTEDSVKKRAYRYIEDN